MKTLENCPALENWSELKSFAMGMRETARYKNFGSLIAGASTLHDPMLDYYRGIVHGLWLKQLTQREKRNILKHYTILRLER
jgi:hypothetical protein